MFEVLIDVLSGFCLIAGALACVISGIGVLRMPDLFTRMHAASIGDTGGMLLVVLGLLLQAGPGSAAVRLVLTAAFLLITGPAATHALARAARHDGVTPDVRGNNES